MRRSKKGITPKRNSLKLLETTIIITNNNNICIHFAEINLGAGIARGDDGELSLNNNNKTSEKKGVLNVIMNYKKVLTFLEFSKNIRFLLLSCCVFHCDRIANK